MLSFLMPGYEAFANDGDTFVAENNDGVGLTYRVLSEADKTAEVTGLDNKYYVFEEVPLVIPSIADGYSVISVATGAFGYNKEFQTIIISEGIQSVGDCAFSECKKLKTVRLPSTIRKLGIESFSSEYIEKIVIAVAAPEQVECSEDAFDHFCHWEDWSTYDDRDYWDRMYDFWYNNTYEDATLFVPKGSAAKYAGIAPWSSFLHIQEFFEPDGDVNSDTDVDISDIVAVINVIAGTDSNAKADVNGDGTADISDIVAVINIISSESTETPSTHTDPAVKKGLCPDEHHPHSIDLGVGVLFSCCNVGASAPWEPGGYYSWGETQEKSDYSWDSYINNTTYEKLGDDIAGTDYDVAYVEWGSGWHMPSIQQFQLLVDHCACERIGLNGMPGLKFTGSNGNAVFLPASGRKLSGGISAESIVGYYWTSTRMSDTETDMKKSNAFMLGKDASTRNMQLNICDGLSVRPITSVPEQSPDLTQIRIKENPAETLEYVGRIGNDFDTALDSLRQLKHIPLEIHKAPLEVLFDYDDRLFFGIAYGDCAMYSDVLDTKGNYYLRSWYAPSESLRTE